MATLSATHTPPASLHALTAESLPSIDLSTLTQSELRVLSLCSPMAFDLSRSDNLVIPTIDPSLFNESAGSHRQTFSRPSPNSHHSSHHHPFRHRLPGLLPSPKPPLFTPHHDLENFENRCIISSLKASLKSLPEFQHLDFSSPPPSDTALAMRDTKVNFEARDTMMMGLGKRKRGRKPKLKSMGSLSEEREWGLEILNKNGVAVDLLALAAVEDPFGEELRRRTEGMAGNEEALLAFMRDLGGQWCSRRKKRKIVDASIFGDALPVGWKLLLGLKRREGRASVYCRRYISPGGKQFISSKEVSEYLQSYFGCRDAHQTINQLGESIQPDYEMASVSYAGATKRDDQKQYDELQKDVNLLGIDNLADVQIHDLFECHKCNMTFDEKDAYLEHLLSFHQRSTRRYRLGSSVGDGVIVRDGKFECQFCHKVFHERRRYNGHVGIHVRNYVRGIEDSPGQLTTQKRIEDPSPTKEELPMRISKMDALIEIAQSSILEAAANAPSDEPNDRLGSHKLNVVSNSEIPAFNFDHEVNSDSSVSDSEAEDDMTHSTSNQELCQERGDHAIIDEKMEEFDEASNAVSMGSFLDATDPANEQSLNVNILGTSVGKGDIAFNVDKLDKPDLEQQSVADGYSIVLSGSEALSNLENNSKLVCANTECSMVDRMDDKKNSGLVMGYDKKNSELVMGSEKINSGLDNDMVIETGHQASEEHIPCEQVQKSSMQIPVPEKP